MTPNDLTTLLPTMLPIPAGSFLMGTPEAELSALARAYGGTRESYREEAPRHTVAVAAFTMAEIPVSNRLYAAFVHATGAQAPPLWHAASPPADRLNHAVVDVTWHDAQAFCSWLSHYLFPKRYRLPTEAEWEYAARGTDGRRFPWGDAWEQERAATREAGLTSSPLPGSYPAGASPFGCLDLAGTVWEWTASLDLPYPYDANDGRNDATRPERRILRGGCYANPHGYARCACRFRLAPGVRNEFLGFRLACTL